MIALYPRRKSFRNEMLNLCMMKYFVRNNLLVNYMEQKIYFPFNRLNAYCYGNGNSVIKMINKSSQNNGVYMFILKNTVQEKSLHTPVIFVKL